MKNYMKFEEQRIGEVKRGFTTVHDAMERCAGYICCMRDMGVISVDRAGEETMNMIEKFIELEKHLIKSCVCEECGTLLILSDGVEPNENEKCPVCNSKVYF